MEDGGCSIFTEGTSDSEDKLQDLEEDENFFASNDIPKLQFRYLQSFHGFPYQCELFFWFSNLKF